MFIGGACDTMHNVLSESIVFYCFIQWEQQHDIIHYQRREPNTASKQQHAVTYITHDSKMERTNFKGSTTPIRQPTLQAQPLDRTKEQLVVNHLSIVLCLTTACVRFVFGVRCFVNVG